jgi:hypothetical protein
MSEPAAFGAVYSDLKLIRTRKCVQIVFEVPIENFDHAYQALGGMPDNSRSDWFAIAKMKKAEA